MVRILLLIDRHEATGGKGYFEDEKLADATGASLRDVHDQLDLLAGRSYVDVVKGAFGR